MFESARPENVLDIVLILITLDKTFRKRARKVIIIHYQLCISITKQQNSFLSSVLAVSLILNEDRIVSVID